MSYRNNPAAIRALVGDDCVHRDVYINPELFELEMEQLWHNTWLFVGHASQVPEPGDFYATTLARKPIIMVRDSDREVRVLFNRCAHKGTQVVNAVSGNVGPAFRCPYHGWTYRLNGALRSVPVKSGYDGTRFSECSAANGLSAINAVRNYRGFVFARLGAHGPDFEEYFGGSLSSIDNMVDRSPEGRLEVAGGVLRYLHGCNWKMFIENLNDTMHPMVAHESSAGTAKSLWSGQPADAPKPMVIEQFVPFVSDYTFFDNMGVRIYENGHSYTGVNFSIHSSYSAVPEYDSAMVRAYGEQRAHAILGEVRHNTVYYPSLTIKGAIQAIRVARPIAYNKTLIESWTFRLAGAPPQLLQRTLMYSRLINAPTSVVGHDDLLCYQAIQKGLEAEGNDWISLHRGFTPAEQDRVQGDYNGNNEISMRSQFRAWAQFMTRNMRQEAAA